LNSSISYHAR